MRLILALALAFFAGAVPAHADPFFGTIESGGSALADPKPSLSHPRKIVMSLSESELPRINEVIGNVGNIQKFYGADNVDIALVAYGPGIRAVLKSSSPVKSRIDGLLAIGINVLACKATLDSMHKSPADLIPGVQTVPNGLPEIVELQLLGWVYIRP